jgi:hypothetical protein
MPPAPAIIDRRRAKAAATHSEAQLSRVRKALRALTEVNARPALLRLSKTLKMRAEGAMPNRTAELSSYPGLEMILDVIASWVKKHRYAVELRREFQRCGADQIARDLGITTRELYDSVRNGPAAADELHGVSLALGVDLNALAAADPITLRDLHRSCIVCRHKKQCRNDLAAHATAEKVWNYCPNAAVLGSLVTAN